MKFLYISISTLEQNSERQLINTIDNCQLIEDKCSGTVQFFKCKTPN